MRQESPQAQRDREWRDAETTRLSGRIAEFLGLDEKGERAPTPPTQYELDRQQRVLDARKAKAERFAQALLKAGVEPAECSGWSFEYWVKWAAKHVVPKPPNSPESVEMTCARLRELRGGS